MPVEQLWKNPDWLGSLLPAANRFTERLGPGTCELPNYRPFAEPVPSRFRSFPSGNHAGGASQSFDASREPGTRRPRCSHQKHYAKVTKGVGRRRKAGRIN